MTHYLSISTGVSYTMSTNEGKGFFKAAGANIYFESKGHGEIYYYCMLELQIRACGIKNSIYYQKNIE